MIPWALIDKAHVPGGGELRLMRRGDEFSIMLGSNELMNSRLGGSEAALATLCCGKIGRRPDARVLIGGLGMGFTLRSALAALGSSARIEVAELVPEVIAWARGPMEEVFGGCLADPRVEVLRMDVRRPIEAARGGYDAILLDVDNGPDGLTRASNDALYGASGLAAAHAALRPGGVFSVWSSGRDPAFTARLRKAGFAVEEVAPRAQGGKGGRHVVWLATRRQS